MQNYFQQFGDRLSCSLMVNPKTGKPRGFGFVTFTSDETEHLILSQEHVIDGKEVDVKLCTPKVLNRMIRLENDAIDSRKIFLGGIPPFAKEKQLHIAFEQHFGQVEEVVIICRPNYQDGQPKSRGFGFVTFDNEEVAKLAVQQRFIFFLGKQVEIKPAQPKNPCELKHSPTKYCVVPSSGGYQSMAARSDVCRNLPFYGFVPTNSITSPVFTSSPHQNGYSHTPNPEQPILQLRPNGFIAPTPAPPANLLISQPIPKAVSPPQQPVVVCDQSYSNWFKSWFDRTLQIAQQMPSHSPAQSLHIVNRANFYDSVCTLNKCARIS
ncbi:DAZ-associated protein 1-like isoform X2 [Watersipora subatra]